jgi:2-polyprenyl-3-methyl-5-hydroxy-6-metoxy-1,4-benzoquinol methylase
MHFTGERVVIGDMKNYIPTLQEHIARYNFALQPALNKTVLDAACGTGYGTNILKEAASKVAGVDIDKDTIAYASNLYQDIEFGIMDLNRVFPSEKFDLCVSFETIEHLEKPDAFLQSVADNCKEFLFSIPVNNPSKYHVQVWNKDQIYDMMNKYWANITWFHQVGFSIYQGAKDATFLIGYATK